ncbi:uncharacterized protein LOC128994885 [Macrosteles quadrilineatus]|uniref:uncharacterized protein LOC128994885 n=1 Tax=Macrosteles quadrilineatus TaxID=74068 RepID=UPI0023E122BC|nr:uncharacterized protein LOC128994885 [Macrosteles quadrilineatus]
MSGILDDPEEYKKNPLFEPHIYSDYSYFYFTASVCTIFLIVLCAINVFFCWCSSERHYWKDSNTGNRWILPIWVKLPSKQPPLDLAELEADYAGPRPVYDTEVPEEFVELQKRESDL